MSLVVRKLASLIALTVALVLPSAARADLLTINLDTTFTGTPPVGTSPFVTATFSSDVAGVVSLTITNNLPAGEFIDTFLFNIDPYLHSNLTVLKDGGVAPSSISKGTNAFGNNNVPGFGFNTSGLFDFQLNFPSPKASRFDGGLSSTYSIFGGSITAASFNFLSATPGGPYLAAAHVQGIPFLGGTVSGGIGASPMAAVPEPATALMLGLGLAGSAAAGLRRRRRAAR